MERLTKWNESSHKHAYYPRCFEEPCYGSGCKIKDCPFETAVCERLAAYEDTGLTPEQCENAKAIIEYAFRDDTSKAERIRELLKADKDGRILILPCKLGTKVYRIRYKIVDYPAKPEPEITTTWFTPEYREDIGKTVFLTREEAEKDLQKMEGKKDG
nr:MAG TPA: hypothetical protein [Caudoviricetes sp.]